MAPVAVIWPAAVVLAFLASVAAMMIFLRVATVLDLLDNPGGRKSHARSVPVIGGISVLTSLVATMGLTGLAPQSIYFLCALCLIASIGVWDDIAEIRPRIKFVGQIAAAALMIWGAGVELTNVGDILGWRPIGLWYFAIPLTIFAVVGVVNSINMIDGLDGLAGSIALIAFAWYGAVAALSGLTTSFRIAMIFCGAIAGFLVFNLRHPGQPRARAFLGDAGSLMLGFALAWYAIDLTQGERRTFPPIAALWVLLLPLADCVSLMTRRLRAGRSPFVADNHHIHHYLLARGFTHRQTLAVLLSVSTIFAAIGFFGWQLGVPEPALFWPFFFLYFAYHHWIRCAWRKLDANSSNPLNTV